MSAQNASGNTALHVCALYNQVTTIYLHFWCVCVDVLMHCIKNGIVVIIYLKYYIYLVC